MEWWASAAAHMRQESDKADSIHGRHIKLTPLRWSVIACHSSWATSLVFSTVWVSLFSARGFILSWWSPSP